MPFTRAIPRVGAKNSAPNHASKASLQRHTIAALKRESQDREKEEGGAKILENVRRKPTGAQCVELAWAMGPFEAVGALKQLEALAIFYCLPLGHQRYVLVVQRPKPKEAAWNIFCLPLRNLLACDPELAETLID